MVGMKRAIRATADQGRHQCEAGYCRDRACVDFARHIRVPGVPGECRFLCCFHARGIKGHVEVHQLSAEASVR